MGRRPANPDSNAQPHGLRELLAARRAESGRFELRSLWWALLDWWEENHRLRRWVLVSVAGLAALAAAGWWYVPRWYKHNTVRLAREWLASGKMSNAAEAIKQAIEASPEDPDTWRVAAAFARRVGKHEAALEYSRRAAERAPGSVDDALWWASDAVVAGRTEEAGRALAALPPGARASSGPAQRIAGELALKEGRPADAVKAFRESVRLEGPRSNNEIPLGTLLFASNDPAEHAEGARLLEKWTSDRTVGGYALRPLLEEAIARGNPGDMKRWGEALLQSPSCLIGDIPRCLLALSRSDAAAFDRALSELARIHSASPEKAALLIGWLNQIGRADQALAFARALPADMRNGPPVALGMLESLRLESRWSDLDGAASQASWSDDVDYLRSAYRMLAEERLGNRAGAIDQWDHLREHCEINRSHALFAGDTLYAWGLTDKAVALLWVAAKEPKVQNLALGTLLRHFQVQRDAEGQYRVFRMLHSQHPEDRGLGNNFAFFAALTERDGALARDVARANYERDPSSAAAASTYAFVLAREMRLREALKVVEPFTSQLDRLPGLRYTYAFILARSGRRDEALKLASTLELGTLSLAEEKLLRSATSGQ